MRIIGLTGSIACGKTTVSRYISACGYPVVDGDQLSRELTAAGSPVLLEIRDAFGTRFLNDNGTLNRRALGRVVFENPDARALLDRIMAPHLMNLTRERIDYHCRSGAPLCVLDMPLLFEKGYDSLCDTVWTVWLPQKEQLSRLMSRDGFSEPEAMNRINCVMSSDEKAARADHVIDNSGTVQNTLDQVSALLEAELRGESGTTAHAGAAQQSPQNPGPLPVRNAAPPAAEPFTMQRPDTAHRQPSRRKVEWRMPVWLRSLLIACTLVLAVGITAYALMSGYLQQQADRHEAERKAIEQNYPVVYRDLIEQYSAKYNLQPALVTAVIKNESSFDRYAESEVKARGLMQLMPDTAEWIAGKLGVSGFSFERMYDPASNIEFGCWYLNYLSRLFGGNPVCVVSAYHAGQGQVKIWLSDPSRSPDGLSLSKDSLPDGPTKQYVERVTRDYGIYQEKEFSPPLPDPDIGDTASV